MKALKCLRALTILSSRTQKPLVNFTTSRRFSAALPEKENRITTITFSEGEDDNSSVFDSTDYTLPNTSSYSSTEIAEKPTWEEKYRAKVNRTIFGEETQNKTVEEEEEERKLRANLLAKALLQAALEKLDDAEEGEEEMVVKVEDQKSLSVGIIGAPNAGKSVLTNFMVRLYGSIQLAHYLVQFLDCIKLNLTLKLKLICCELNAYQVNPPVS